MLGAVLNCVLWPVFRIRCSQLKLDDDGIVVNKVSQAIAKADAHHQVAKNTSSLSLSSTMSSSSSRTEEYDDGGNERHSKKFKSANEQAHSSVQSKSSKHMLGLHVQVYA